MMKKNILQLALVAACSLPAATGMAQSLPAFPGAEGFGMYTQGGRAANTKVYHVTTLEDNGTTSLKGSLRWANAQSGPRIIVFDVSGTIHLKAALRFGTNTTVLGQTAPGDGICLADYPVTVNSNNVIRYVRFRLGNKYVAYHEGDGLGGMDLNNVIIDHCSVSWSIDECLSVYGSRNITVQWCIASQSLVNAGHSKGAHGYGGNWGGSGATYHHNLMAHHGSREPRLGPRPGTQTDERMDLRNNVFYNWSGEGSYGGEGMNVNIVNNYYKPGPATFTRSATIQKRISAIGIRTSSYTLHDTATPNEWDKMWHVWGKFYVRGNFNLFNPDVTKDNWTYGMYNQISASSNDGTYTAATRDTMQIGLPIAFYPVTTETAQEAYTKVLAYAGASLHRDWVDSLVVSDTRLCEASFTGSGLAPGLINTQDDLRPAKADATWSAWPVLAQATAPTDTDGDGLPDSWEQANGTDPAVNDAAKLAANGYTNIENYANSLVAHITEGQLEGGTLLQDRQEAETGIADEVFPKNKRDAELAGIVTIGSSTPTAADGRIYSLSGQLMPSDTALPSGVYISNNKKFVVK
jgi:hypothetical protein